VASPLAANTSWIAAGHGVAQPPKVVPGDAVACSTGGADVLVLELPFHLVLKKEKKKKI
jgi:hypothetical protein